MSGGTSNISQVKGFTIVYQIIATMLIIAVIPLGGLWYIRIWPPISLLAKSKS